MKKICLLMALLLAISAFAACSQNTPAGNDTTLDSVFTDGVTSQTEEVTEADTTYDDEVPKDLTFEGYEFVMAFPNPDSSGLDFQIVDKGDAVTVMDSAIYERNLQIEDRFDISLTGFTAGYTDTQTSFLITSALSGDDALDLAFIAFTFSGIPWITSGYAMPWNDIEYIDTDRVYWNDSMNENLSFAGKSFLIQGDLNWPSMHFTQGCFFNVNVARDYNIENLYEAVDNGTWTFDKLKSTAKMVARDVNNDAIYDENDQYGLTMAFYGGVYQIGISANYQTVLNTDEGFVLNYDTEKFASIVDYAYDLLYNNGLTYIARKPNLGDDSNAFEIFYNDRALFMFTCLNVGNLLRNREADYGIIPDPKYDENQEKYCTTSDQWGLACSLPVTATNTARTGAITEALCALSGKLVYPTYYEYVLSARNTRDEDSIRMIDLIFSNVIYDPGISFAVHEVYIPLNKLMMDLSTDLSSWVARYGKKIQAQYDDAFEYVVENFK